MATTDRTSVIIRSITKEDRARLDALKRMTRNATDSGAMVHAMRHAEEMARRAEGWRAQAEANRQRAERVEAKLKHFLRALGELKEAAA